MTVLEASNLLFDWFSQNDVFCLDDVLKILVISEDKEKDIAALKCALKEFKKNKLVNETFIEKINKTFVENKKYWVLRKSLDSYNQNIEIDTETAIHISKLINSMCNVIEDKEGICDAKNINRDDIKNLIVICAELIKNKLEDLKTE